MSLYGKYIKERENTEIIETPYGFATYKVLDDSLYVIDIYILPEFRRLGKAEDLMNQSYNIAKELEKKWVLGSVCLDANGREASLMAAFYWGMTISHYNGNMIYLKKEIK